MLTRAVSLACVAALWCAAGDLEVTWQRVADVAGQKTIEVVRRDGSRVRGRVASVAAESMRLEHRGKFVDVPRAEVPEFRLMRSGFKWKLIGGIIGLGAGLAIALPVNAYAHNEGDGAPLAVAAAVAVPVALGLWAGWAADRHAIRVRIRNVAP